MSAETPPSPSDEELDQLARDVRAWQRRSRFATFAATVAGTITALVCALIAISFGDSDTPRLLTKVGAAVVAVIVGAVFVGVQKALGPKGQKPF
ncbi:MAG: hypothetical protein AAGH15_06810 [Myxococcota bacterium]